MRLPLTAVAEGLSRATAPARAIAGAFLPRGRAADLDERDPDVMRELLPGLWLIVSLWFRPDVRGLHHLPRDGAALVVGNHTGGTSSPEVSVSQLAFSTYLGVERRHHQLAHVGVVRSPVGALLRRFGTLEAGHENAELALDAGAILTVFPGGDHEVFRPSWESARIDFGDRKGWVKLALRKDVPVIPMVTLGGQETALFLARGDRLASLLRLDRALRLKALPVMLSLPFGLQVGPQQHLPLPAKITIQLLEPIDLREAYGPDPDVDEVYADVTRRMQDVLTELQRERRLPVLG